MENLGFLYAIGAALCWGTYMVPFKKSKSESLIQFQTLMSVGILLSGFIISLLVGFPLNFNIYGIIAGVFWAIGNTLALIAIKNLGLSKAVPLMSSIVILSTFLWGALVFGELPSGLFFASFGLLLIIAGVVIVSARGESRSENIKAGLIAAILGGLVFGSQLVPLKLGHVSAANFFFSTCLGIFITALAIFLFKPVKFKNEAIKESLLSGTIWNIGNFLSIASVSLIGLAKGYPLSQSSVLVAVLWGVFYFKEITQPKHKLQVLIGAVILLIGVITLGLA